MLKKYLLIISLVIVYLFIMNHLPSFEENGIIFNDSSNPSYGINENVGISERYTFSVKRPRIYGTFYESDYDSNLKFMNILNIPLKKEKFNLKPFHYIFLLIIIFLIIHTEKHKKVHSYY